ncbi:MAG: proteasome accessory factor PafA2 family protein, partial [Myxococcota bacterium]
PVGALLIGLGWTDPETLDARLAQPGHFDGLLERGLIVYMALFFPAMQLILAAAQLVAYRPYRRAAMGFLVSRPVLSGAGTVREDGRFALSEKIEGLTATMRRFATNGERTLLDTGLFLKPVQGLGLLLDGRRFLHLFEARQRLQLGMSDANRCDVAEYLKLGTTALVLDMVEAGVLRDAPRPRRVVRSARALSRDPELQVRVPVRGGQMSAIELQRFYCERAATWIDEVSAPVEVHQLVRLWRETLDALETDPSSLVGRLDWVTKRALIERVGADDLETLKTVDLRYHELGPMGYFDWIEDAGLVTSLVDELDVTEAMRSPPIDTPARQRGRLVKALAESGTTARIGWREVRVGGRRGQVIRLDEHRSVRGKSE